MPGSRREAGLLTLIGIVIALVGSGGIGLAIGGVMFAAGAVLWLIHYSADLRKPEG